MKLKPQVKDAMQTLGMTKLRKNQVKPINSILDRHDTVVRAATGYGKSMIYLVPGVISEDLTVVIEPLLALMHEQVRRLRELDIEAEYIDHTRAPKERLGICEKARDGTLKILYISPEQVDRGLLTGLSAHRKICLIAIDECHCGLSWGNTFRPAYLEIGKAIDELEHRPVVLALSATIPPQDLKMMEQLLSMHEPKLFNFPLYRSNLVFMKKKTDTNYEKLRETKKALCKYHKEGTAIIFCATKTLTEAVAEQLEKKYKGEVSVYHSGKKKHDSYNDGKRHIIVATTALSMGVDIPNVNLVINFNMPLSLSDFSQMAGRAGREGQLSHCLLLWSKGDYLNNRYMLEDIEDPKSRKRALKGLDEMKEFCDDNTHCMVKSLLNSLGDDYDRECRYCTVCQEKRRARQ